MGQAQPASGAPPVASDEVERVVQAARDVLGEGERPPAPKPEAGCEVCATDPISHYPTLKVALDWNRVKEAMKEGKSRGEALTLGAIWEPGSPAQSAFMLDLLLVEVQKAKDEGRLEPFLTGLERLKKKFPDAVKSLRV